MFNNFSSIIDINWSLVGTIVVAGIILGILFLIVYSIFSIIVIANDSPSYEPRRIDPD